MNKPTLSILLPNYNHAGYIGDALDAILSQSFAPMEVIVSDHSSTDNSVEIIESYANKYQNVSIVITPRSISLVQQVNNLTSLAKGDYVYFAGADDKVLPGFFEKTMNLLTRHPQAGLCSGLTLRMNMAGENIGLDYLPIVSPRPVYFSSKQCKAMICKYNNWIHSTATIYRRDALLAAGGFIPELYSYCDVFTGFVIALMYGVCYIPEPLSAFRITNSNYRSNFTKQPEILFEVKESMNRLINSSYADLFPIEFIEEIEKVAIYNYNRILHPENIIPRLYFFLHSRRKIYYPFLRKCLKLSNTVVNWKCRQIKI